MSNYAPSTNKDNVETSDYKALTSSQSKTSTAKRRHRNIELNQHNTEVKNKWDTYREIMKKLVTSLKRKMHYIEGYNLQSKKLDNAMKFNANQYDETKVIEESAVKLKCLILDTFKRIDDECDEYTRWPQLDEPDDNGLVDLESVMCSVCNQQDREGNDILICDRAGCYLAYHQHCLSPPISKIPDNDLDDDIPWFCWRCECLSDCLENVNDFLLESEETDWRRLFPEIRVSNSVNEDPSHASGCNEPDDEDDDQDEDFVIDNESSKESDISGSVSDDFSDNPENDDYSENNEESIDNDEIKALLLESGLPQHELNLLTCQPQPDNSAERRYNFRTKQNQSREIAESNYIPWMSMSDVGRPVAKVVRGYLTTGQVTAFHPPDSNHTSSSSSSSSTDLVTNVTMSESYNNEFASKSSNGQFMWTCVYAKDSIEETVDEQGLRLVIGVLLTRNCYSCSHVFCRLGLQLYVEYAEEQDRLQMQVAAQQQIPDTQVSRLD